MSKHWVAVAACLCLFAIAVPAAGADPRVIDSIGQLETDARARSMPSNPVVWVPELVLFVEFDDWAQEDVLLIEWREGKKAIGKPLVCGASQFIDSPIHVARFECGFDRAQGISRAGAFSLGLTYKQPLAGKTYPLGTLALKVIELKQGSQNRQTSTYIEDRDHHLGMATIEEYSGGPNDAEELLQDAAEKHGRLQRGNHEVAIRLWTKNDHQGSATMTCLLDGKKAGEAGAVGRGRSSSYWTFKGAERKSVNYTQQTFVFLRMVHGKADAPNPNRFFLGDNPGDYRCVALAGGEVVGEVFFTVDAAGEIARTACDAQANLLRHVHIVRYRPTGDANLPVDRARGKTGFFGRITWKAGCPSK